jgi:hypothetical protein
MHRAHRSRCPAKAVEGRLRNGFRPGAPRRLDLGEWDRSELGRLDGNLGSFESLRVRMEALDEKVEQEIVQREIEKRLRLRLEDCAPQSQTRR